MKYYAFNICVISSAFETKNRNKIKRISERIVLNSSINKDDVNIEYLWIGNNLSADFIHLLKEFQLAILFVSDSIGVFNFTIGVMHSLKLPTILIINNSQVSHVYYNETIVAKFDIEDVFIQKNYGKELINELSGLIKDSFAKKALFDVLFYKLWFPRDVSHINIVVAPEVEKPIDANIASPNYGFLDGVGDKDAIYEIVKMLSRHYPQTSINLYESSSFNPATIDDNLVVIGGPGGTNYTPYTGHTLNDDGNRICRIMSEKINTSISYTSDCDYMVVKGSPLGADYDENNLMRSDYGYFAAINNPFSSEHRVILIHGIHTLGVVGAALSFSDGKQSENNYQILYEVIKTNNVDDIGFESFFKVDVFKGRALCPGINLKDFFLIKSSSVPSIYSTSIIDSISETNEIETLSTQVEMLWKDIISEVDVYKDSAPNDYKLFKEIADTLYDYKTQLDNDNLSSDDINNIKTSYSDYNKKWRSRR